MAQLKFYKGSNQPSTAAAGAIWFSTTDRTIRVYTGSTWEKYAGLVDASWNATDKLLTITSAAGATTTLDLSDCASASDISAKLTTINNTLTDHNTRINTAQAAAEAAQAHSEGVAGDLAQEITDRTNAITGVEGLISAEAATARAAEQANAAAAKAADDKAVAAQTYAEGVNTALGQEVTRATGEEARIAGLVSAEESRAKAEEERLAGLISSAASGATTEVKEAEGGNTYVKVAESEGASGQKIYTISEHDIASAQGLADEIGRATAVEEGLAGRIDALDKAETGRVSVLEKKVDALNAATHFEGKVEGDTFDAAIAAAVAAGKEFEAGDIVIYGNKEYIFDGTSWIELGDTTAEQERISALEGWKTTASQTIANNTAAIESNDGDITALQNRAKDIEDNITNNIATKQELTEGLSGLQTQITSNDGDITSLQNKDAEFDEWIDAHETAFEELTETVSGKVDQSAFDTLSGKVTTAEGKITNLEAGVANLKVATGFEGAYEANAGATYISGAASLRDADNKLDAAIKAVAQSVTDKNVSASGDGTYVAATADANHVTVSAIVANEIKEDATGLATAQAVFNALAWADFS